MSFLKKLFNFGGAAKPPVAAVEKSLEHNGYFIRATPYQEAGRFQLRGVISKEINGETKEHEFIRADTFMSAEDAVEMTFFKGRQIIDQQGERIFNV